MPSISSSVPGPFPNPTLECGNIFDRVDQSSHLSRRRTRTGPRATRPDYPVAAQTPIGGATTWHDQNKRVRTADPKELSVTIRRAGYLGVKYTTLALTAPSAMNAPPGHTKMALFLFFRSPLQSPTVMVPPLATVTVPLGVISSVVPTDT